MKNPVTYYAIIALGVVALLIGGYLRLATAHHTSSYAAIAVGALLVIGGVVGMFVMKPTRAAR
jgi:uncharacterized membrane protein HdeD (DUF308 family)